MIFHIITSLTYISIFFKSNEPFSNALQAVDGVESVDVSLDEKKAVVTLTKEVSDADLTAAVEAEDFTVTAVEFA